MELERYTEKCDDGGYGGIRVIEEERCAGKCDEVDSSSTSSCVSEVPEPHEDAQFLRLLDAMENLVNCRDSLANSLSKGWMEIASARYSMGLSRIDQALFSLKPCSASTLVSVSRTDCCVEDEGPVEEGEKVCDVQQEHQFVLRGPHTDDPRDSIKSGDQNAQSEALPQSHLRQRHISGLANMQHANNDSEKDESLGNEGDMAQDVSNKLKGSDSLAWFGTLVSPHLRVAQTSFKEALETVVELATAQSTILTAYQQLKESSALV